MENFAKTGRGVKFFSADIPNLIKQLERIADGIENFNFFSEDTEKPIGKFEKLTDEEAAKLVKEGEEFDEFFDKLVENFEIDKVLDEVVDSFSLTSLKNLVRHAWNANK